MYLENIVVYFAEFVNAPQPTAVLLDSDLVLDCHAVDYPEGRPLRYHWNFNDTPIISSLPKTSVFTNNSLFVPQVVTSDLGSYTCIVQLIGQSNSAAYSPPATVVQACTLNLYSFLYSFYCLFQSVLYLVRCVLN